MNGTCLGASSPGNRNVSEPWEQGCLLRRALGRHLRGSGGCGRSGQSRRGCGWCLGRFEAWMIQSHSSYVEALTARTLEHNRFWRCNLRSGCCSVAQSCPTLCHPMGCSTPGFPVLHHVLEFAQTRVHWVSDAIQPFHPLSTPFSSCSQSFPASGSFKVKRGHKGRTLIQWLVSF